YPEGLPIQMDPSSIPSYSFHGAHMDITTLPTAHSRRTAPAPSPLSSRLELRGTLNRAAQQPFCYASKPLADAQLQAHAIRRPREISQRPLIVTVDTMRRCGAEWTRCRELSRAHAQDDLCRGSIDGTRLQAQRGRVG